MKRSTAGFPQGEFSIPMPLSVVATIAAVFVAMLIAIVAQMAGLAPWSVQQTPPEALPAPTPQVQPANSEILALLATLTERIERQDEWMRTQMAASQENPETQNAMLIKILGDQFAHDREMMDDLLDKITLMLQANSEQNEQVIALLTSLAESIRQLLEDRDAERSSESVARTPRIADPRGYGLVPDSEKAETNENVAAVHEIRAEAQAERRDEARELLARVNFETGTVRWPDWLVRRYGTHVAAVNNAMYRKDHWERRNACDRLLAQLKTDLKGYKKSLFTRESLRIPPNQYNDAVKLLEFIRDPWRYGVAQ